eukprot:COSAG05_NODE_2495_length_2983_cov_12.675535_1_plen_75_part_10
MHGGIATRIPTMNSTCRKIDLQKLDLPTCRKIHLRVRTTKLSVFSCVHGHTKHYMCVCACVCLIRVQGRKHGLRS